MPDLIVTPTVQSLTVTPTVQSLVIDETPQLLISVASNAVETSLGSDLTLTASSFVTVLSLSLTAGQWFLFGEIDIYSPSGTPTYVAQISTASGSAVYGSAEGFVRVIGTLHLSVSGYVNLTGPATVALRAWTDGTLKVAKASTQTQTSAKATTLKAIRITI